MTNALQLHLEPSVRRDTNTPALPVTEIETRRRLIWSCFVMDSVPDAFHAGHRPIHSAINPSGVQARLPCDEHSYERGLGANGGTLSGDPGSGPSSASAYLVRMVALRMKILHYAVSSITPHFASQFSCLPWEQGSKFYELCQELNQFKTSLPSDLLQPTTTPIKPAGSIILHLTMHAMFHVASVDLFRIGTHLARRRGSTPSPPAPFVLSCRQSRIDHALGITQVVSDWMRNHNLEHDPFVAICSCVAIRVLVVERWDGNNELVSLSSQDVKDRLEMCRSEASHMETVSRSASPGLDTYGTLGSIQKARTDHDIESACASSSIIFSQPTKQPPSGKDTKTVPPPPYTVPSSENIPNVYLQESDDSLSPDALRIVSNWADGTYDLEASQAQFDWGNLDFGSGFGLDDIFAGTDNSLNTPLP
ncbi:hypothetical protein N7474_004691 [Penicillium riverlandense]|uniref:uncharacterized protein n=1 Tax=Penicillium riverlandense TaxID=1903569 RepID=UPI0025480ABA|nr:uncharacterized protein N7474_004691 [Penicillium riverlandense]KAJ5819100.1 hypothetical protein N7474_004691 [Penicillium riverlandense]